MHICLNKILNKRIGSYLFNVPICFCDKGVCFCYIGRFVQSMANVNVKKKGREGKKKVNKMQI